LKDFKADIIKHQKLIIYGIITLLLVIANYNLFLRPTLASLSQTGPKLNQAKRQLAADQAMVSNIPMYKAQIERMREAMFSHQKQFSTKQEIADLLKNLSEVARDSGVKIVSIKPHPLIDTPSLNIGQSAYQKFPISIKAVCAYHQLGLFLNKLENDNTFMRVSDIKIVSDQKEPAQHLVYILVNTYILNDV
jgi:type IV pilus assembly protein PilO